MSTEQQESADQPVPAAGRPAARAARGPVRRVAGLAARHKVVSGSIAVFAVAVIAVSLMTAKSPAPRTYPAAPAFTVADLGHPGMKISLSQFRGKPLVVNFWASWCDVCQQEAPLLASWYQQQHGHVTMIGLDENDSATAALAYAHAKGMTYPIGFDPLVNVASAYGVSGLPQTFFLDSQHRIVDHLLGAVTRAQLAQGLRLMNAS